MLSSVLTALITATVALVGAWWVRKTAQEAQHASPYDALASRVVALEEADTRKAELIEELQADVRRKGGQLSQLRDEVYTLVDHILVVQAWIDIGMPPPPPIVPETVAVLVRRLRADGHTEPLTPWKAAQ